ncbi:hypothetical protein ACTU3I_00765 [Microbacterium sp. RD1]|uniref:hypothetical protein n=1 Tax=Microbacterium sp. RD1 TaxID=3457313 RepID=UPI003FA60C40
MEVAVVRMSPPPTRRGRMERGIPILIMAAAAVVALTFVLPAARQIAGLLGGETALSLLTDVEMPPGAASHGAAIVSGTYESAWVVATGLGAGTRTLLGLGVGFGALTAALTSGAVVLFLLLLLWGRPFHRALVVATQIAGSALLVGSILSAGLGGLGRMMAADELNRNTGEVFVIGFSFEPAVLAAGIAVLGLSFVFSYGTRLQRDTAGLV